MGVEMFGAVRALFRQRVAAKVADYAALVKSVASGGKPPSPEEVVTILEQAVKSVEKLEADVALVVQRKVWQAMLEEEPVLQQRQAEIGRQKAEINEDSRRRIAAIEAENLAKTKPLDDEWHRGYSRLSTIGIAMPHSRLIETSSLFDQVKVTRDEPVSGNDRTPHGMKVEVLRRERERLATELASANHEVAGLQQGLGIAGRLGLGDSRDASRLATAKEKAGSLTKRLANADADIAALDSRIEAKRAKLSEIEAAALAE